MYADLCELLVPGFLSTSIEIEGHRISLRSFSTQDLYLLRKYVRDDDPSWRVHMVAHCVWMVDGIVLLDSPLAHRVLFDVLMRSSKALIRAIVGTLYGFFLRVKEANYYLEAYLYEAESRRLWGGLGSGQYSLHSKTSIPGIQSLGLNSLQSAWVAWNGLEDLRDQQDYVWSNTKVLVSLQSHKSYEKLSNRDKTREENESGRRASAREAAVHRFLHGEPRAPEDRIAGKSLQKARTNDELEEEMRRWIQGDLDWHDQVVENYKNRIRQEQEDRERQKLEVMAELRARRAAEEQDLGVEKPLLRPISPEQMAEMMKGHSSGSKFIVEADAVSRTFNRFIRPTVEPGNLSVNAYGQIVEQPPVVPAGKEPGASLAEQVAARKVVHEDG